MPQSANSSKKTKKGILRRLINRVFKKKSINNMKIQEDKLKRSKQIYNNYRKTLNPSPIRRMTKKFTVYMKGSSVFDEFTNELKKWVWFNSKDKNINIDRYTTVIDICSKLKDIFTKNRKKTSIIKKSECDIKLEKLCENIMKTETLKTHIKNENLTLCDGVLKLNYSDNNLDTAIRAIQKCVILCVEENKLIQNHNMVKDNRLDSDFYNIKTILKMDEKNIETKIIEITNFLKVMRETRIYQSPNYKIDNIKIKENYNLFKGYQLYYPIEILLYNLPKDKNDIKPTFVIDRYNAFFDFMVNNGYYTEQIKTLNCRDLDQCNNIDVMNKAINKFVQVTLYNSFKNDHKNISLNINELFNTKYFWSVNNFDEIKHTLLYGLPDEIRNNIDTEIRDFIDKIIAIYKLKYNSQNTTIHEHSQYLIDLEKVDTAIKITLLFITIIMLGHKNFVILEKPTDISKNNKKIKYIITYNTIDNQDSTIPDSLNNIRFVIYLSEETEPYARDNEIYLKHADDNNSINNSENTIEKFYDLDNINKINIKNVYHLLNPNLHPY
jgi:hypothetical protein